MDRIIFYCLLFIFGNNQLLSQNSIIDYLQNNIDSSEGRINIYADSAINVLVGVAKRNMTTEKDQETNNKSSSFHIQVFMGNTARTAHSEALSRQAVIKSIFPSISTYVVYKSPSWKLLVGDFFGRKEADVFKNELKNTFPDFGKEMYIVVDK